MIRAEAKLGKSVITSNEKRLSQNYLKSVVRSQTPNGRDSRQAFREKVESLCCQVAALTGEIQKLKWFGLRVESLSVEDGIDFYQEVRHFEISMITQALKFTHGSQKKAALLLKMNQTTLNTKIKNYQIHW